MVEISYASKREVRLGSLFLKLAAIDESTFDIAEYLQTLVEETKGLLPVEEVALFLVDAAGGLGVAAATAPDAHAVESLVLAAEASPCLHAFETGTPVGVDDIRNTREEWVEFAQILQAADFRSVHAIPLRVGEKTIGVASLFSRYPYTPSAVDTEVAAAVMKAAAIAIVQSRALAEQLILTGQLQQALNSRIAIEQAKGVVAQTRQLPMEDAFSLIRDQARRTGQTLQVVSQRIVERTLVI
jgi:GAF domain-containing protein